MGGAVNGFQTTLGQPARMSGIGVHSGRAVSMTLHPAEADSGISFHRTDINGHGLDIPADYRHVCTTDLCTAVGTPKGYVATIEHLMATLRALNIDNVKVEIDGPEVPVMDGSAGSFIDAVDDVGIAALEAPRRYFKVVNPITVRAGESVAEFRPYDGMRVEIEIDFANPLIGRQVFAADIDAEVFRQQIARARTFGFLSDVEALWARGLALGASLENAVVIGDDKVINPEGLRFSDEFVRHKALDAVGDLALIGAPIIGCYRSYRGGHRLNVQAVEALIAQEDAWVSVESPIRVDAGRAGLAAGVGVAAYGPETA